MENRSEQTLFRGALPAGVVCGILERQFFEAA